MKITIGVNVYIFHLFDIERRYIEERCWFLAANIGGISN